MAVSPPLRSPGARRPTRAIGLLAGAPHAPLFRNLVRREVRQRYKGSALGLAWTLITPAIMVGAYSLVFRYLLRVPIENYALFLFVGLTAWTFFLGSATTAAQSLVANANLVKKVSFPRQIVPVAAMVGNAVTPVAMLAVAVPLCLVFASGPLLPMIAAPAVLVPFAVLTLGFGLLLAALNVYFRDVEHILGAVGLPWIFMTPIFYTLDFVRDVGGVPGWVIDVLHYANPVAPPVIAFRDALFFRVWPSPVDVAYSVAAAAIMLALGWRVFRRLEGEMPVEL